MKNFSFHEFLWRYFLKKTFKISVLESRQSCTGRDLKGPLEGTPSPNVSSICNREKQKDDQICVINRPGTQAFCLANEAVYSLYRTR